MGKTGTATYNAAGQIIRGTDPTGRFTENRYDLAGRTVLTASGQEATTPTRSPPPATTWPAGQ
ncbi:hypothetical protein ACFQX7_27025 [Luedemannella flava]